MIKQILHLILFFSSTFLFAQEEEVISFVAYWEDGDHYQFNVNIQSNAYDNDFLMQKDSNSYKVNFEVIDSTETSYTILWTCKNNILHNYKIDDAVKKKLKKYDQLKIKYKTDELGMFEELINWKELGEETIEMFDQMSELLEVDLSSFGKKYSQKEYIERVLLKEIKFFHEPFGLEYDTKETFEFEDELPNDFGLDPIPADVKVYFSDIDSKKYICNLVNKKTLNKKASRAAIRAYASKKNLTEDDEKDWAKTKYISDDISNYKFLYNEGIPLKVQRERVTYIESPDKKVEKFNLVSIEFIKKLKNKKPKPKKKEKEVVKKEDGPVKTSPAEEVVEKVDAKKKEEKEVMPKEKETPIAVKEDKKEPKEKVEAKPKTKEKTQEVVKKDKSQSDEKITNKNYYDFIDALSDAESVTISWLKPEKASPIILDQFSKLGYPLKKNVLYQLDDGQTVILMGYNKEHNIGVVYKPGHSASPQISDRQEKDFYQEIIKNSNYAGNRKIFKTLPDNILVLHENWFWFQKPGSAQNVNYVDQSTSIEILKSDIKDFLKALKEE